MAGDGEGAGHGGTNTQKGPGPLNHHVEEISLPAGNGHSDRGAENSVLWWDPWNAVWHAGVGTLKPRLLRSQRVRWGQGYRLPVLFPAYGDP